ncbi:MULTISPECIES: hypothetical protein [unclassified Sphingopyxis]|uniref:hypothetical protein n=1 Tax=unclassified Sphingopyxis TaxID=2614943 RepID=UPI00073633E2|nr:MULTISPECIES: hypothetical protein [unclassified Sphingopyxis]KTE37318.1 hypothetical protein ATE62_14155 [Sphingopyxis sp. HIX]KTE84296.1 hypothetical protein ATE72_09460 [Sphingopyxis sp. HXXIV]
MKRQHATPVLIAAGGGASEQLTAMPLGVDGHGFSEAAIQELVQAYPGCLPIAEIDSLFVDPVPICTELNTPAGAIDNFMVTATGLPVLVECKLWRNPQGRREVVGQILDYAKELGRWSCSDLQREVSRRLKLDGNPLIDLVRAAGYAVDEIAFNDALTHNLRRGRFLLLIVGDGIREGVEAITEHLQRHAGLHFTLGLVEMPIFAATNGDRLVVPRVVARTETIIRHVVAVPEGMAVEESAADGTAGEEQVDPEIAAWSEERRQFWADFQAGLQLDDPDQIVGRPPKMGYTTLMMPAPGGAVWLTIFRDMTLQEVGLFLSHHSTGTGLEVAQALMEDSDAILAELGPTARIVDNKGRPRIIDSLRTGPLDRPDNREAAFAWLRRRTNDFVNVFRPRVRALAQDLAKGSE